MSPKVLRFLGAAASLVMLISILAGCGSSSTTGTSTSTKKVKVGLVTDIGGLNDNGFNHLADVGLMNAKAKFGIQADVKESKSGDDYVPNLTAFATQGYDLVIAVGFLMQDAVGGVSASFPNTHFAIIDGAPTDPTTHQNVTRTNVESLFFSEQEAGALVGVIAGMEEKANNDPKKSNTISAVGGQDIPPVDHYIAGYQWASKMEDPSIKVLVGFSQDFVDQVKCHDIAKSQIANGSDIVFQVAGQCGLGALKAAGENNVWSIGVDTDQKSQDKSVIASAVKRVETATYDAIQDQVNGKFTSGVHQFNLKNGGVGYTPGNLDLPSDIQAELKKVSDEITSGSVTVPTDVQK